MSASQPIYLSSDDEDQEDIIPIYSKEELCRFIENQSTPRTFKRGRLTYNATIHSISLKNLPKAMDPSDALAAVIDDFIEKAVTEADYGSEARFVLSIHHPGLRESGGFHLPSNSTKVINGHAILNQMSSMMQSNEELSIDQQFKLEVLVMKPPENLPKKKKTSL